MLILLILISELRELHMLRAFCGSLIDANLIDSYF